MRKIPVFETAGHAYAFAFRSYLGVLEVVWLPQLVLGALAYLTLGPAMRIIIAGIADIAANPKDQSRVERFTAAMNHANGFIWLFNLLEIVLSAIMIVGVTKEALGLRKGFRAVYVRFGSEEVLMAATYFVAGAILVAVIFAAILGVALCAGIAAGIAGVASNAQTAGIVAGIVALFGGIAAFVAAIYVTIRAFYLVAPVTVAENRFGLWRSWELMHGNTLRAFAIFLLTMLPLMIIQWIAAAVAAAPAVLSLIAAAQKGGEAGFEAQFQVLLNAVPQYLPWFGLALILLSPIAFGLLIAPSAFAYRALVPEAPGGAGAASAPARAA